IAIAGVEFFGIGGGIPVTPFGAWSYDFSEEQAAILLRDCPHGCVLISHSPPKGAVDRDSGGPRPGRVPGPDPVRRAPPPLVVCGHIHGCAGQQERIGSSTVVNAGPKGIEWELGGDDARSRT